MVLQDKIQHDLFISKASKFPIVEAAVALVKKSCRKTTFAQRSLRKLSIKTFGQRLSIMTVCSVGISDFFTKLKRNMNAAERTVHVAELSVAVAHTVSCAVFVKNEGLAWRERTLRQDNNVC